MIVNLLTQHNLEFLNVKGGCRGSAESTLIKMPHCWKSHVAAQINATTYTKRGRKENVLNYVHIREYTLIRLTIRESRIQ